MKQSPNFQTVPLALVSNVPSVVSQELSNDNLYQVRCVAFNKRESLVACTYNSFNHYNGGDKVKVWKTQPVFEDFLDCVFILNIPTLGNNFEERVTEMDFCPLSDDFCTVHRSGFLRVWESTNGFKLKFTQRIGMRETEILFKFAPLGRVFAISRTQSVKPEPTIEFWRDKEEEEDDAEDKIALSFIKYASVPIGPSFYYAKSITFDAHLGQYLAAVCATGFCIWNVVKLQCVWAYKPVIHRWFTSDYDGSRMFCGNDYIEQMKVYPATSAYNVFGNSRLNFRDVSASKVSDLAFVLHEADYCGILEKQRQLFRFSPGTREDIESGHSCGLALSRSGELLAYGTRRHEMKLFRVDIAWLRRGRYVKLFYLDHAREKVLQKATEETDCSPFALVHALCKVPHDVVCDILTWV